MTLTHIRTIKIVWSTYNWSNICVSQIMYRKQFSYNLCSTIWKSWVPYVRYNYSLFFVSWDFSWFLINLWWRSNNIIFNTYLVLTASIVDIIWYISLTFLVTSKVTLKFIKNRNILLQKFVGSVFIIIGVILLIQILIWE